MKISKINIFISCDQKPEFTRFLVITKRMRNFRIRGGITYLY